MPVPQEVFLIDVAYVKKFTVINGAVDENLILPAIVLCQDTYLTNYLGETLIDKIKTDYAAGSISGYYSTLLDNYIRKALMWWVMCETLPKMLYKADNGGLVTASSETTQPISDEILQMEITRAANNAKQYTQKMSNYINANTANFPELNSDLFPKQRRKTNAYPGIRVSVSRGNTAMSRENNQRGYPFDFPGNFPQNNYNP